jgi:hypothetical protein
MKIDKTRFLFLTTTLAASAAAAMMVTSSGCSSTATNTDGGATPTTDSGTDSSSDSSTDAGPACLGDNGNAPYCGPAGEGGDPDAGDDAGEDAGGTADGGNAPVCPYECRSAVDSFKKGVATAINDCLNKGAANACETSLKTCVEQALPKACDDATAKTFCEGLVAKCSGDAGNGGGDDAGDAGDAGASTGTLTQQKCESFVKALNAKGRENFTSCMTEGDVCVGDADYCIDLFKQ